MRSCGPIAVSTSIISRLGLRLGGSSTGRAAAGTVVGSKLGPTGLGSGIDKDRQDFTIYSGGWAMGRIYEQRGGPDSMRWFWSLHGIFGKPADMPRRSRATLDEAKAQFEIDLAAMAGVGEAA